MFKIKSKMYVNWTNTEDHNIVIKIITVIVIRSIIFKIRACIFFSDGPSTQPHTTGQYFETQGF